MSSSSSLNSPALLLCGVLLVLSLAGVADSSSDTSCCCLENLGFSSAAQVSLGYPVLHHSFDAGTNLNEMTKCAATPTVATCELGSCAYATGKVGAQALSLTSGRVLTGPLELARNERTFCVWLYLENAGAGTWQCAMGYWAADRMIAYLGVNPSGQLGEYFHDGVGTNQRNLVLPDVFPSKTWAGKEGRAPCTRECSFQTFICKRFKK